MKKIFSNLTILLMLSSFVFTSCHNDLWDAIDGLDNRVTKLEELCKQMNQDISALKTIVDALSSGDYVTNIIEIKQGGEVVGYSITFSKHDPITIYSGSNGKNGENGKDGLTPVIGVAQENGVYYWTLNGQWLLDANGNKIRVTGENGQDGAKGDKGDKGDKGETGATGQTGSNGNNGADGVTPQLKIEDGMWYVSYDNGTSWTEVGRATGNNGTNGTNGADGDSMFSDVSFDDYYVYITLVDGTILPVVRGSASEEDGPGQIIDGAIQATFSVSPTAKVRFSQGLLQYNASLGSHLCLDGTTKPGTWRFAVNQLETLEYSNDSASAEYTGWFDMFAWATSGVDLPPYHREGSGSLADFPTEDIDGTNYDWGVYNSISNGGNIPGLWHTLTASEWLYLLNERPSANHLKGMILLTDATPYNKYVLMLLPDDFVMPGKLWWLKSISISTATGLKKYELNELVAAGAVLLPLDGYWYTRIWNYVSSSQGPFDFWSSTIIDNNPADAGTLDILMTGSNPPTYSVRTGSIPKYVPTYVRLVKDVQ